MTSTEKFLDRYGPWYVYLFMVLPAQLTFVGFLIAAPFLLVYLLVGAVVECFK